MNQDQVLGLISAHLGADAERFRSICLQIVASLKAKKRDVLADRIERLIGRATLKPIELGTEAGSVLSRLDLGRSLSDLILDREIRGPIEEFAREWRGRDLLRERGLEARHRILLLGPPGTGKTATAGALARELGLPLYVARLDALVESYLGKTGQNLRKVFDAARHVQGVYLLDEMDALASARVGRHGESDVGEMRRALNSLLQFLEEPLAGIVVGASNLAEILDPAIYRRFELTLTYRMPNEGERKELVRRTLERAALPFDELVAWNPIRERLNGLSHAEVELRALALARKMVLEGVPAEPAASRA